MSDGLTREELHEAVDRAVGALLDEAGVAGPPTDVALLARHLGLHPGGPPRPARGRAAVVARGETGPGQLAWLEAHAIGQHLRPGILRGLGVDPKEPRALSGESLPNLFADRLLVPTRWLLQLGREHGWDLFALEERLRPASHGRIAWRMLDLAEPVAITILDNGHVSRRRSNAFAVTRELAEPEKRCQQVVHRFSRPHELREEGWRVQGWPLHGVDWKSEILRSQYEGG